MSTWCLISEEAPKPATSSKMYAVVSIPYHYLSAVVILDGIKCHHIYSCFLSNDIGHHVMCPLRGDMSVHIISLLEICQTRPFNWSVEPFTIKLCISIYPNTTPLSSFKILTLTLLSIMHFELIFICKD